MMLGQLPACFWPVDDPHPSFSTPRLHHNFTFWTWSVPKKGWAKWSLEGLQTIYRVDWRINCPNLDLKTFPVSSGHFKSVLNTFLYILQLKMALTPWTMEQDMWFQIKNSLILGYLDTCWSAFTCVRKNLTQIKQSYCEKNNSTISKNSKTECVSEDSEQVRLCYPSNARIGGCPYDYLIVCLVVDLDLDFMQCLQDESIHQESMLESKSWPQWSDTMLVSILVLDVHW